MIQTALVALSLLCGGLPVSAAVLIEAEEPVGLARKIQPLGGYHWEPADAFRTLGMGWCENGRFVDAGVLPGRREIRLACAGYGDQAQGLDVQVLDAQARAVSREAVPGRFERVGWLGRRNSPPLAVAWDWTKVSIFDEKGGVGKISATGGFSSVAWLGQEDGGPLVAVGHYSGAAGVSAYLPDGKPAWETAEVYDVRNLAAARLRGKPVFLALHGMGRLAFLDASGRVVSRAALGGNIDRVLLDDAAAPRLYAFDSHAEHARESVIIFEGRRQGRTWEWERRGSVDLGPVTITAYALGDFDGSGRRTPVVGTSNGWIFALDRDGAPTAELKLLSPIQALAAADLQGDKADELVAVIAGASENVLVFARGTRR